MLKALKNFVNGVNLFTFTHFLIQANKYISKMFQFCPSYCWNEWIKLIRPVYEVFFYQIAEFQKIITVTVEWLLSFLKIFHLFRDILLCHLSHRNSNFWMVSKNVFCMPMRLMIHQMLFCVGTYCHQYISSLFVIYFRKISVSEWKYTKTVKFVCRW